MQRPRIFKINHIPVISTRKPDNARPLIITNKPGPQVKKHMERHGHQPKPEQNSAVSRQKSNEKSNSKTAKNFLKPQYLFYPETALKTSRLKKRMTRKCNCHNYK